LYEVKILEAENYRLTTMLNQLVKKKKKKIRLR